MSETKVNPVADENPSVAEKEEAVLEKAGVSTKLDDGTYKIDLDKINKTQQENVETVVEEKTEEKLEEKVEEPVQEPVEEPITLINEEQDGVQVQEQESLQEVEQVEQEIEEKQEVKLEYPEDVKNLLDFMSETGGSLEDYVKLNVDYNNLDDNALLREYYKQTKPHLSDDEISFLMEDSFLIDEEVDSERDIKRKQLNYKEQVAGAKNHLTSMKQKYYNDIKSGSKMSPDVKEAVDFYSNYKKEQEELTALQQKSNEHFLSKTDNVFNNEFKGFEFKVGENRYRYNVKDVNETKQAQSDVLKAFKMFLDENNMLKDAQGYHKALYVARNADSIANHFYEQGKADAVKSMSLQAKNINMDPRKGAQNIEAGGLRVRAIGGDDSSKLRIKLRK